MGNITLSAATAEHAKALVAEMRKLDVQEVIASSGPDVLASTLLGLRVSHQPVAAHTPDGLLCLFGIAPYSIMGDTASPWCLGTDRMSDLHTAAEFLGIAANFFVWARERYPKLINHVDARNKPSVRWLARLGCTIDEPAPFGVAGLPFHRFHMGLDNV